MVDQYKGDIGSTDSAPAGAKALTEAIADERKEFEERIFRIGKLVGELGGKAIALNCSRSEYDSLLEILPRIAVLSQRKEIDFTASEKLMPHIKEAQDHIGKETLEPVIKYFKDVLEKIESFKRKVIAENGAQYFTDFDDKPGSVRQDFADIFKTMREGMFVNRKLIGHPLDPYKEYPERKRVPLDDKSHETENLPQFEYVLKVLRQLDGGILDSLEAGGETENASKLILLRASEQCQLMYNEFAGQYLTCLRIDEQAGDMMGETEIEKLMTALNMTEKALLCLFRTKEALRWLK